MQDVRKKWREIATLSIAGFKAREVADQVGITVGQVNRARWAMQKEGMLPKFKRGYRPKAKPQLSCGDYAEHIAGTLARLHDERACEGSYDDADRLIRDTLSEIERQAWELIQRNVAMAA